MGPEDVRVVTYVARGLEAMRDFDIFVRVVNRITAVMSNVLFVVVGSGWIHFGNDLRHMKLKTLGEHVLRTGRPDPTRFRILGSNPSEQLVEVLCLSDLHIYLTVPFVFWWSLLNALAFEWTVLASDEAPVREVNETERTGMLAGIFDAMPSGPRGYASSRTRPLFDRLPVLSVH